MSLFSTYSTGENRVTATILAVLRALSFNHMERILGAILGAPELQLVQFSNQVARGGGGVPDAEIFGSFHLLIETKTARNAVDVGQLKRHLEKLESFAAATKMLLVLTPDNAVPDALKDFPKNRVVWSGFAELHQAIEELLKDRGEVVSEREAYLLRALQDMLEKEHLLTAGDEVLVVAARWALDEYLESHAYICQPNRAFRDVKQMAFYTAGKIARWIPRIEDKLPAVEFRRGARAGRFGQVIDSALERGTRQEGQMQMVMLLSPPEDKNTFVLEDEVRNDLAKAFTQGQRYVSLADLKKAKTTSDLVKRTADR